MQNLIHNNTTFFLEVVFLYPPSSISRFYTEEGAPVLEPMGSTPIRHVLTFFHEKTADFSTRFASFYTFLLFKVSIDSGKKPYG